MSESKTAPHPVTFNEALFLLLLGLKLSKQIDWSWWWVFAPIIAQVAIGVLVAVIVTYIANRK